jgi:hypothetical protein
MTMSKSLRRIALIVALTLAISWVASVMALMLSIMARMLHDMLLWLRLTRQPRVQEFISFTSRHAAQTGMVISYVFEIQSCVKRLLNKSTLRDQRSPDITELSLVKTKRKASACPLYPRSGNFGA